jgi:hypothetical protein
MSNHPNYESPVNISPPTPSLHPPLFTLFSQEVKNEKSLGL